MQSTILITFCIAFTVQLFKKHISWSLTMCQTLPVLRRQKEKGTIPVFSILEENRGNKNTVKDYLC